MEPLIHQFVENIFNNQSDFLEPNWIFICSADLEKKC